MPKRSENSVNMIRDYSIHRWERQIPEMVEFKKHRASETEQP